MVKNVTLKNQLQLQHSKIKLQINRLPRKPRNAHENISESGSIFVRLNEFPRKSNYRMIAVFTILALLIVSSVALYIFSRTYAHSIRLGIPMTPLAFERIMSRTIPAIIGMTAAGVIIAIVSLAFQTITQSRLLTPSMIGFDSVFIGTQTILVFAFGSFTPFFTSPIRNFLVTSGVMVVISMFMFGTILRRNKNNIIFLLMFGIVLSGIVSNGARYLQSFMSFYDFYHVQAATAVTVMNMNTDVINIAWPIISVVAVLIVMRHKTYDVMSLGSEQAQGLGVSYNRELNYTLILISVGMSVATAMIGSLAFLGLLVVNASRELIKTHKHLPLFICSAGVAVVTLVLGSAVEQLLQGAIPLTTIINLVGCAYVFYLIWKENRI